MASRSSFGRETRRFWNTKEKRRIRRKPLQVDASIRLDGGFALRPCTIMDLSETGARLRVKGMQAVPDHFNLVYLRNQTKGRPCRIKWRRNADIGVEFTSI
jgi:hypothetical protein